MTSIRPADDADMAAVAEVWHAGWHDAHPGHVPDGLTALRTLAAFHERAPLRVPDTTVATSADGGLLGFVMVVGDEVEQVYVSSAGRGTGVAATLLAEAERQVAAAVRASGRHTDRARACAIRMTSARWSYVQALASRPTISVSRSGEVAMLSRTWPVVPGA